MTINMDVIIFYSLLLICVDGSIQEFELITSLLQNYSPFVRPVGDISDKVMVKIGLAVNQLIDMDERNQILNLKVWMRMGWHDEHLRWDSSAYDQFANITNIHLPAKNIWLPDITLYSDVSQSDTIDGTEYPAVISKDGSVAWNYPSVLHTTCMIQVQYVPWDQQACPLKFGSWTFDGASLDMTNASSAGDVSVFVKNGEWELIGVPVIRHNLYYACCENPYPDVTFWLVLRRKPLYYLFNLLTPCLFIVATTILVFYLPPDCGEKISLSVTGLLALTVFLLMVAEALPPQSDSIPLIGAYFATTIILLSLSTVLTVVVLNLYHHGNFGDDVPVWLSVLVLRFLARLMCMRKTVQKNISPLKRQRNKEKNQVNILDVKPAHLKIVESNCNDNRKDCNETTCETNYLIHGNVLLEIKDLLKEMRQQQQKQEVDDTCKNDWMLVAIVLDRFFLFFFLFMTIVVSLCILLNHPDYTDFTLDSVVE